MATERPRPALPHELVVAHDERHSYMQRMYTLAGPGAYMIPSTFKRPSPNMLLRVVQRENYGREFSRQKRTSETTNTAAESTLDGPCQLCLVTAADTHRARRDQLRQLLVGQVDHCCHDASVSSPSECGRRAVAESSRLSISRSSSPSRRRWVSADLADIVADFGEEPPSKDVGRTQQQQQQQPCSISAPLTYQHFLMSTSYLERLKKQQQQQQHRHWRPRAASQ